MKKLFLVKIENVAVVYAEDHGGASSLAHQYRHDYWPNVRIREISTPEDLPERWADEVPYGDTTQKCSEILIERALLEDETGKIS